MEFEWDPDKATGNLRKHKVSFTEPWAVVDWSLTSIAAGAFGSSALES